MSEEVSDPSAAPEARAAELERQLAAVQATARERLVLAELRTEAVRAGMVDLDGLKLVDTALVTVADSGEVAGAAAVMRELRRAKPWLFGAASSSSTAGAPPAQPPRPRLATEMGFEEWQKARAELLKRR